MNEKKCEKCGKTSNKYVKKLCNKCFLEPKRKFYYNVKVETMLPATLLYRVLAETPEQAALLIKRINPITVNYKLAQKKDISLKVYEMGSSIIRYILNLKGK